MPRNAAGTYTLPLPPVVTNTTITSNFENTTDSDIASELTNSLDRNGRGGMLAPFKIFDGTMAAPGLAFTLEPGSGLWRAGPGDVRMAVLGVDVVKFIAGQTTFIGNLASPVSIAGTTAQLFLVGGAGVGEGPMIRFRRGAPDLAFIGIESAILNNNADNFLITAPAGSIRFRSGGNTVANFHNAGLQMEAGFFISSLDPVVKFAQGIAITVGSGLYLDGGNDTFISESGPDTIDIVAGGIARFRINGVTGNNTNFGSLAVTSGNPIFFDGGGGGDFIYSSALDQLQIVAGGTPVLTLNKVGVDISRFHAGISIPDGQGLYLDGGSDTFIFHAAPDVIGFIVGGTQVANITGAGVLNVNVANPIVNLNGGAANAIGPALRFQRGGVTKGVLSTESIIQGNNSDDIMLFAEAGLAIKFAVNGSGTDRARLTPAGYFKAGTSYPFVGIATHELVSDGAAVNYVANITNTTGVAANGLGIILRYLNVAPNNTNEFLLCFDSVGQKASIRNNGGLANFQANDVNLSDATVKNYWEPYSAVQLDALCAAVDALDFGRYKYRDQTHDDWNHGYVAQNVRDAFADAAPELVDWWEPEKKELLSVYSTDFVNINLAVAKHEIRKLKAEVAALKARMN